MRTESGSIYLLEQHADDGSESITRVRDPDDPVASARLRRDGATLQVLRWVVAPRVGASMIYAVEVVGDGVTVTYRTSTPVTSITDLDPDRR